MSDLDLRIAELHVHPVKSCAGLRVDHAELTPTGLAWDRHWMILDARGQFLTQREDARLALIRPEFGPGVLHLHAPGQPVLELPLEAHGTPVHVKVWDDRVAALDVGNAAAQWLSRALSPGLRLVRFDPAHERLCSQRWTTPDVAMTAFSDGYPLLVTSTAALTELNARLAAAGAAPVDMRRFRPNLVLDGLDAHGEDWLAEIRFDTPEGPVCIRPVKPCARCPIPDIDPDTTARGHAVGDALAAYRADARLDGALTFGMNAIVTQGLGATLRVGMRGHAEIAF